MKAKCVFSPDSMTERERFLRTTHFKDVDRPPYWENLGFWPETIKRWHSEGLPKRIDLEEYYGILYDGTRRGHIRLLNFFGFDRREMMAVGSYCSPNLFYLGPFPPFPSRVLEETAEYRIVIDEFGVKKKELKNVRSQHMPQFLDYPVKSKEDFREIMNRFNPFSTERYPRNWSQILKDYNGRTYPLGVEVYGFFGQPREMMGLKRLLTGFFRFPELLNEIMDFWLEFNMKALEKPLSEVQVDYAIIWEDMSYRKGPMISPGTFEEFILPRYQSLINFFTAHGIDIIMVDTDGNCEKLIPYLLEGGVTCLYPVERQADMNPLEIREEYGEKLALIGGVDKKVLHSSYPAIRKYLENLLPDLLFTGGYIPSVDHVVPSDISFRNYMYYLKTAREITKKVLKS